MNLNSIGARIRYYREKAGMTQEQLGDAVDVNTETISKYERDVITPSFLMMVNIALALSVPLKSLFQIEAWEPNTAFVNSEAFQSIKSLDTKELQQVLNILYAAKYLQRNTEQND